jgi:hypothetical protein
MFLAGSIFKLLQLNALSNKHVITNILKPEILFLQNYTYNSLSNLIVAKTCNLRSTKSVPLTRK